MNTDEPVAAQTRHPRRWLLLAVVLLVAVAAGAAGWYVWRSRHAPARQPVAAQAPKLSGTVAGRYLFNGTIFWGRGIEHWAQRPDGSYDYAHPFSGLNTFNRQQYDAWVADLECPITNKTVPFATQVSRLIFNCRPEYVAEAAKYFNILDLANNHTDNMGPEGLPATRSYLEQAGVQYFGNYDPAAAEDVCEVVALPVKVTAHGTAPKPAQLPVAFCAWHYFGRQPRAGEVEAMHKYSDVMPVFAFVHMGPEYYTQAQAGQVAIAHQVADQGPEFVVANNPHWVQNTEVYKGKLIVYSTGNFIFDQLDKEGMQSVSLDAAMTVPYNDALAQWLELGTTCRAYHDECLRRVTERKLPKPKLSFTYNVVAGDNSGKLTKKGSDALQQTIEQRTNWAQTLSALGQAR